MGTDRTWKRNKARQKRNGAELDLMMRVLSAPLRNGFFCVLRVCVCEVDGWWVGVCGVFHLLKFPSLSKTPLSLRPQPPSVVCQLQLCHSLFYLLLHLCLSYLTNFFSLSILYSLCSMFFLLGSYLFGLHGAADISCLVSFYCSFALQQHHCPDWLCFIHWLFKSTTVEVEHFDPLMVASSGRIYCIQENHLTWYATGIFIFLVFTSSSSSLCITFLYLLQKKREHNSDQNVPMTHCS